MKTIGITTDIKNMIVVYAEDGERINDTLSRLLDNVGELDEFQPKTQRRTNITISEDNFDKLNSLKSNKESYNSVIERLITAEKGKSD